MHAILCGRVTTIYFLIEQGINLNLSDNDGNTALHYAVSILSIYSDSLKLKITQILVENGIDISIKNEWGNTALDIAKSDNLEEIISLLSKEKRKKALIQIR